MILHGSAVEVPVSSIASLRHVDGETEVHLLNGSLIRLQGTVHLPEPQKEVHHE